MDPRLHDLHEPLAHNQHHLLHHSSPASTLPPLPLSPAMARYTMQQSDPYPLGTASFDRIEAIGGGSGSGIGHHSLSRSDFVATSAAMHPQDELASLTSSASGSSLLRRVIVLGETQANRGYCSNKLQTAKFETTWELLVYGLISCIFSSVASVYFFTVGLLQIFTPWSPTGKFATMGPYAGNKVFEMACLFWFNKKDQINDKQINSRKVKVVTRAGMVTKQRKDLAVGDLVHIEECIGTTGEERVEVPADLLLVYSDTRSVFLDMSSLTGEKDSVQRKVPLGLEIERPDSDPMYGVLYATEPKPDLEQFRAELRIGTRRYDCTYENMILAGSYLFKGRDVYGIVVATGKDTKIRLKQKPTGKKSWSLQNRLNIITTVTLFFLFSFILLGTTGYTTSHEDAAFFQVIAMYFLLFNGLIAQTLQFTLDAVRGIQTFDVDAEVKNPCAVEQLGLTQAIVFDKTGTLTQNQLEPQLLSVMYDRVYTIHDKHLGVAKTIEPSQRTGQLRALLLSICLNNSVMRAKEGLSNKPHYFGTSADEVAILEKLYSSVGYFIVSRSVTPDGEEMEVHTEPNDDVGHVWELLYVYKYTSERGMMTVMVKNKVTGEVFFHSKGSPEKMYGYLREDDRAEAERRVNELAKDGLRVLLYAAVKLDWARIEEQFTAAWATQEEDGVAIQIFMRDHLKDLYALGATGTEDQLQPRLLETIQKVQSGNIITLVCTGDIKMTAEIIGRNCGILPVGPDAEVFDIHQHPDLSLEMQLDAALKSKKSKGLLVGKQELMDILEDKSLSRVFINLVKTCKGVVTYRAHPKLKAQLTHFLMKNGLFTCSVGDGANDIDMIKQANVGIGIKDGENTHAAGSSDLAIKRVGELPKLIFYHGKKNWERNTKMTHLITCMKMTVVLSLLFYDFFYVGFSAVSLFTGRMLLAYNFFYGWATAVYGIFHHSYRSVPEALDNPARWLNKPGFKLQALSISRSFLWWTKAALDSILCLTITMWWWRPSTGLVGVEDVVVPQVLPSYFIFADKLVMAEFCCFVVIMIWVNLRVSLVTDHLAVHAAVVATLIAFFVVAVLPVWPYLESGFVPFVLMMVAIFLAYNKLLDFMVHIVRRVIRRVRQDREVRRREEDKRRAEAFEREFDRIVKDRNEKRESSGSRLRRRRVKSTELRHPLDSLHSVSSPTLPTYSTLAVSPRSPSVAPAIAVTSPRSSKASSSSSSASTSHSSSSSSTLRIPKPSILGESTGRTIHDQLQQPQPAREWKRNSSGSHQHERSRHHSSEEEAPSPRSASPGPYNQHHHHAGLLASTNKSSSSSSSSSMAPSQLSSLRSSPSSADD
jgi:magnesium-transporting ATPase (P-type)